MVCPHRRAEMNERQQGTQAGRGRTGTNMCNGRFADSYSCYTMKPQQKGEKCSRAKVELAGMGQCVFQTPLERRGAETDCSD